MKSENGNIFFLDVVEWKWASAEKGSANKKKRKKKEEEEEV